MVLLATITNVAICAKIGADGSRARPDQKGIRYQTFILAVIRRRTGVAALMNQRRRHLGSRYHLRSGFSKAGIRLLGAAAASSVKPLQFMGIYDPVDEIDRIPADHRPEIYILSIRKICHYFRSALLCQASAPQRRLTTSTFERRRQRHILASVASLLPDRSGRVPVEIRRTVHEMELEQFK